METTVELFTKKTGIELIAQERAEQLSKHNRTIEQDVKNNDSEELICGAMALLNIDFPDEIIEGRDISKFPSKWDNSICQKMVNKPYKERLIIAGALIAAEIDRLQNTGNTATEIVGFRAIVEQGKGVDFSGHTIHLPGVEYKHEVPVRYNFGGEILGKAKIELEEGKLVGSFTLEKDKIKNVDLLNGLWPAVSVSDVEFQGNKVISCKLDSVGLCINRNSDPTIPPIKFTLQE